MLSTPAMEHYRQAVQSAEERDWPSARHHLTLCIQEDPRCYDGYLLLGRVLREAGEAGQAAAVLESLHARFPDDVDVGLELVGAWREVGEPERACRLLRQLARMQPNEEAPL